MHRVIAVALFTFPIWGCAVHHHHHHHYGDAAPPEQVDHSEQVDHAEQVDHSEQVDHTQQATVQQPEVAQQPPTGSTVEEQAPTSSQEGEPGAGPLEDCQVEDYPSGWVEAICGDLRINLMTGPAAQRSREYLVALSQEHSARLLGREIRTHARDAAPVQLRAGSYPVQRITYEPMRGTPTGFGPPSPEVNGEGLLLLAPTTHGNSAIVCFQEGRLDEERCLRYLDDLTSMPLDRFGSPADSVVTVAGVEVRRSRTCNFNQPENLVCLLQNHLKWTRGTPAKARRAHEALIRTYTDDNGIPGYHNPHEVFDCTIGGHSATCHEIAQQGVTDSPHRILYAALVDTRDASYAIYCDVRVEDEFSEPCRQIFGQVSSGRWHR